MFRGACVAWLVSMCAVAGGCAAATPMQASSTKLGVNRQRIIEYGRKINLVASDVPRLVKARYPQIRVTATGPFGAYVEKCDGVEAQSSGVLALPSGRFHSAEGGGRTEHGLFPVESVQSAVYFMGSSSLASRELSAASSERGQQCLRQSLLSGPAIFRPEKATKNVPLLSNVGVSSSQWRIDSTMIYFLKTMADTASEEPRADGAPNYYQDTLAFAVGSRIVELNTVGSPQPFPAAEERRLLSILHARAG